MQLARVIGDVVMSVKDENLAGIKLLLLQPLTTDRQPAGRPLVAVDSVGAGVGEEVFFVRGRASVLSRRAAGRRLIAGSSTTDLG